jgi:hypothetical protein
MKQLFCVVVTDPGEVIGLISPIIYHIECETKSQAEDFVKDELTSEEDYGYDQEDVETLDLFTFPVTDLDIVKL